MWSLLTKKIIGSYFVIFILQYDRYYHWSLCWMIKRKAENETNALFYFDLYLYIKTYLKNWSEGLSTARIMDAQPAFLHVLCLMLFSTQLVNTYWLVICILSLSPQASVGAFSPCWRSNDYELQESEKDLSNRANVDHDLCFFCNLVTYTHTTFTIPIVKRSYLNLICVSAAYF